MNRIPALYWQRSLSRGGSRQCPSECSLTRGLARARGWLEHGVNTASPAHEVSERLRIGFTELLAPRCSWRDSVRDHARPTEVSTRGACLRSVRIPWTNRFLLVSGSAGPSHSGGWPARTRGMWTNSMSSASALGYSHLINARRSAVTATSWAGSAPLGARYVPVRRD